MNAVVFWCFFFYSLLGWGLERIFAALTHSPSQRRRCFLLLPLCPVYGLGMLAVLALPPMGWLELAFWGSLAATVVEYAVHWAYEFFFGIRVWDYSQVSGNLKGRVCLPFSLAWAPLTVLAVRFVQPGLTLLAEAIPPAFTYVCLLVFTADAVCSIQFLRVTGDLEALRGLLPAGRS